MSLKSSLRGTGVAIVTPFNEDHTIDFEALGKIIDFQIDGGIEYLVTLGTTGETPTISREEQIQIIEFTYEKVAGRVPVVVGIGGNNTQAVVETLKTFPLEKATAVLSSAPYYSKPSQEGIFQHYKALAAASPKPILLYNVPHRTGKNIDADTVIRLANEVANIGGIKEACGNFTQFARILRDVPEDFLVTSGEDDIAIPQIAMGMQGVITVAGNAFPKEVSTIVRLALEGKFKEATQVNNKILEVFTLLFNENNPAGVKAFLFEKGLIKNELRLPVVPLSAENHSKIKAFLKSYDA
ncbi:4-hydroxy-tetrahydrodipicolinate synthase [Arachidicoccus ginsenosidivorans]|jgi:4-hydroxy-tetrahydrodipicolinate synthase|uniref:4-hydroxy-tetrahydrodipicolinate synthase n=1 Tax=Arachidicoccus ginsenosidivorans TaxID=496057 RepID=A0A5B8VS77_9BACT|nr:4-hydroxy-tetrahydrodipicolinate synthase [Arachidicoccus ginsenosidivorans]QEC73435.1 4-hydroxy-tetrahydrodipicolinate synthase [Arachidicoccus ginsenosidivorans]